MGKQPEVNRAQLVERGRKWAQALVGIWVEIQLPTLNDTRVCFSKRPCSRQIRVLKVYKDFALVEIRAKGRGSWRESVDFAVLGAQVRVKRKRKPAAPRPPKVRPCGCAISRDDVALCDEGRRLWSESLRNRRWADYEAHIRVAKR